MSQISVQHTQAASRAVRPNRRRCGALLASTAFTGAFMVGVAGHPQSALAACAGENTASVTCDAANPATAGTLNTSSAGSATVNVNAGGAITNGGATATVAAGSLTFSNNDIANGITNVGGTGVTLINTDGRLTYVGNANVTAIGGLGMQVLGDGLGDILVTNNAAVSGTSVGISVSHSGTGAVRVDGNGSVTSANSEAISAANSGPGSGAGTNGVVVSGSGSAITNGGDAIRAVINNAANASNVLVDRAGTISGSTRGIFAANSGTGSVTVAGNNTITSTGGLGIFAQQTNAAPGTVGNITISGSGDINAGGQNGIVAVVTGASNAGNVTIDRNGTITAAGIVISAQVAGTGNASVTGVGDVGGAAIDAGISAATAAGNVLVARDGVISAAGFGIATIANGSGTSTVTISKNVTSTGNDGVQTTTSAGLNTVNVTGGRVRALGNGIDARSVTGNIAVTVGAGAAVESQNGTGVRLVNGTTNTIVNNGTISGVVGVQTTAGATTVTNTGSITGSGVAAVRFLGANNLFVMSGPGARLTGTAIGSGTDTFRLAGSGANTFDASQITLGWTLLDKVGTSTWTLTGASMFAGAVTVREGTLLVNGGFGSASGVTVASGATLGGNAALPATTILAGGTLAPGNSIGTILISRSLTFVGAGNYVVEVSPTSSDFTNVTGAPGTATLSGTLRAVGTGGTYTIGKRYPVLRAGGGISGTFGNLAIAGDFGLTRPHIEYDTNYVYLVLDLAAISSFLAGGTPNQRAVAGAVDAAFLSGSTAAPFTALVGLTSPQLNAALDQLSGEVHASTAGVLMDESLYARSAILGRLRQASYGGAPNGADMASMAALTLGGPQVAFADDALESMLAYAKSPIVTKAPLKAPQASADVVFWAQGFGAWGRFDGDGNAASVRRDLAGFITGVDTRVGNGRLGIAAGYTGSKNALDGRGSSNVETGHIAGYGGWSFGALNLRAGGAYAFHAIATDRTISIPGFFDRVFANYDGHTGQIFGEVGYGLALGNVALEPFAGGAWVRVQTDAAAERGGLAALNVASTTFETGYSTLGVRAAGMVPVASDMMLIPRGALAWQHAFNSVTPQAVLAFQAAPVPFTISGVPIARDSLLAEAGLDLAIGRHATVGVSYTGQIAGNVTDHAAKGKFSWKF